MTIKRLKKLRRSIKYASMACRGVDMAAWEALEEAADCLSRAIEAMQNRGRAWRTSPHRCTPDNTK